MPKKNHKYLILLLPILFLSTVTAQITVDVGVVLDYQKSIVKSWNTSIFIAYEDFYRKHSNYSTKLILHREDSNSTSIGAASKTLDLLRNVGVKAIIGPMGSEQAVFMSELGKIAQVPILSFSATSPSLSSSSGSYFVRTTLNDSSQVGAISALVNQFRWREVVLIYEDTEFGTGIAPYLVDALREVGARITYRYVVPVSTSEAEMEEQMQILMDLRTRVFVVHMVPTLASRFFSKADKWGMLGNDYFWIMTDGPTESFRDFDPFVVKKMKGVLGVKPSVPSSKDVDNFSRRWKEKFSHDYPDEDETAPTAYDMWAYDTIWALAMGVEKVGDLEGTETGNSSANLLSLNVSSKGPKLLSEIRNTNFIGLSGSFRLTEGQLEPSAFELMNVGDTGLERIGYWTPTNGISRHLKLKENITDSEWPKNLQNQPRGWQWPTKGKKLRIGVPLADGFLELADVDYVKEEHKNIARGFCVDVLEAALAKLPYKVPHEYILYVNSTGEPNGTYDDLIREIYHKTFDVVVGDTTILSERTKYVDFTTPYTESGVVMVVPNKEDSIGWWAFLDPMTTELWLASGGFFIFTGLVIWLMEHRKNKAFQGSLSQQLGAILYFIFSTLVFSHKEKITSNLARVVLIMWVFVVLILTSSYTASLSSILTSDQLRTNITNVDDLVHNKDYIGYLDGSFVKSLLVTQLGFNESHLKAYSSPVEYDEALSKGSSNGGVSAIFDEIPYIKVFLYKYPSKYSVVGRSYKTDGFGFVFPRGSPLLPDVSRAILSVKESPEMLNLERKLYGDSLYGPLNSSEERVNGGSNRLPFKRFSGLFLITGVTSTSALFLHIVFSLCKTRVNKGTKKEDEIINRGPSLSSYPSSISNNTNQNSADEEKMTTVGSPQGNMNFSIRQ